MHPVCYLGKKKEKRKKEQQHNNNKNNRVDGLSIPRYFENGPLEPG